MHPPLSFKFRAPLRQLRVPLPPGVSAGWRRPCQGRWPPVEPLHRPDTLLIPMAALDLDRIEPLSPEKAVVAQDVAGLRYVLERGWEPRKVGLRDGAGTRDLSVPLSVVINGWEEGWLELRRALPYLGQASSLWEAALQYAQPRIVADFIEQGMDIRVRSVSGLSPSHIVVHAMAQSASMPWGAPVSLGSREVDEDRVLKTLDVLAAAGVDIEEPHPGSFARGDLAPAGHTLWTRAIAHRRWTVADRRLPDSWPEVVRQPRALEAVLYLQECARNGEEAAQALWHRWLNAFLVPWMGTGEARFDRPEDAPFLEALPVRERTWVWAQWAIPDESGWTGLHQLALMASDPRAAALLRRIVSDQGACLQAWNLDDDAAISPARLWAMALYEKEGSVPSATPVPPVSLESALQAA